jgi:hypothetical protein
MFDSIINEIFKADSALANFYLFYLLGCLALGLLFGLFGKKLFYFWMGFLGYAIGFIAFSALNAGIVEATLAGLVCGLLNIFIYRLGVGLTGFVIGLLACTAIFTNVLIGFLGGFLGAVLALIISDFVIVVSSSIFGAGLVSYFIFSIFGVAVGNSSATITAVDFGASIIDYLITFGASEAIIFAGYYGIIFIFIAIIFSLFQYFGLMKSKAQKAKQTSKELSRIEKIRSVLATKLKQDSALAKVIYFINPHWNPDTKLATPKQMRDEKLKESFGKVGHELKESFGKVGHELGGTSGILKKFVKWIAIGFFSIVILILVLFIVL